MGSYKNTEIGLIPKDWELNKLENVAQKLKAGGTPKTTEKSYWNGNIPLVKVEDVVNCHKYLDVTNLFITQSGLDNSSAYLLPNNSLLFTMYGTAGEVAINTVPVAPTQNVLGIITSENIDSEFLYYALKFSKTHSLEQIVDRTIFKHFTLAKAKNLLIPCPAVINEQQNIAFILSKIQSAIETQEKIIKTATELKKALMQKLFTEGLNSEPQKDTEIGKVPRSWGVLDLGNLLLVAQYGLSKRGLATGEYPILRMTNQNEGKTILNSLQYVDIDEKTFLKFRLNVGDVIFNRTNSIDLVGRTSIFDVAGDYVFASYLIRLIVNKELLNPYFLNLYLNMDDTQRRLKKLATRGVSQSNISATRLKTLKIVLPLIDEQQKILYIFYGIDKKITTAKAKKNILESLFHSMLHQLMTGQTRVNNINL